MIKITPNRIFTSSRDSALERFNTDEQRESGSLSQKQLNISALLDANPITPRILAEQNKDYMRDRSYADVSGLMKSAKDTRELEYKEFSKFEIQDYEKEVIEKLYIQAQQLMHSFESAIEKYKENEEVLGIIYDFIDSFDQMSTFYSPLCTLEYLANDTVTVSTKFRPFFVE